MTKIVSEVDDKWTQEEVDARFPDVDPGVKPSGSRVVLQIRSAVHKSRGGVWFPPDISESELFLTQTGMVRAVGPVAFRNRDTLELWPEGVWAKIGSFVRMPKYNQDKWWVEYEVPGGKNREGQTIKNKALFMMVNDLDILGERTGNPFAIAGYLR